MGEKMAQAIRAAAVVSAAKRGTQAQAQSETPAGMGTEGPSAQASAGAPEIGKEIASPTAEAVSSESHAGVLPEAEPAAIPETSPVRETEVNAPAASMLEPILDTHLEARPNGGQGISVEVVSSTPQTEAPANPGTGAEAVPAETDISNESLPAGTQS